MPLFLLLVTVYISPFFLLISNNKYLSSKLSVCFFSPNFISSVRDPYLLKDDFLKEVDALNEMLSFMKVVLNTRFFFFSLLKKG